jgi:hypothetical protein
LHLGLRFLGQPQDELVQEVIMRGYEVTLHDVSTYGNPDIEQATGPEYGTRSVALITKIDEVAKLNSAKISHTIERHCSTQHYPPEMERCCTTATYAFISGGELAVFIRNVLVALTDWRELSKARIVTVRLMDREIELAKGTDIDGFLRSAGT